MKVKMVFNYLLFIINIIGVIYVFFKLANILYRKNILEQNLKIIEDENIDIIKNLENTEKEVDNLLYETNKYIKKCDNLVYEANQIVADVFNNYEEMIEVNNNIINKIFIISDFFGDNEIKADEKLAKIESYLQLIMKDIIIQKEIEQIHSQKNYDNSKNKGYEIE